MTTYRRRKDSDTWHWCKNCNNWPASNCEETEKSGRPSGDLCNECRSKESNGTCTKA